MEFEKILNEGSYFGMTKLNYETQMLALEGELQIIKNRMDELEFDQNDTKERILAAVKETPDLLEYDSEDPFVQSWWEEYRVNIVKILNRDPRDPQDAPQGNDPRDGLKFKNNIEKVASQAATSFLNVSEKIGKEFEDFIALMKSLESLQGSDDLDINDPSNIDKLEHFTKLFNGFK